MSPKLFQTSVNFSFDFLQELLMLCEAISDTRKSVSSDIQTPRSWLKKTRLSPRFFNPLLSVWVSDETLYLVLDMLLENVTSRFSNNFSIVPDRLTRKM